MKTEMKAWIYVLVAVLAFGNMIALFTSATNHGATWSELKYYLVSMSAASSLCVVLVMAAATWFYTEEC